MVGCTREVGCWTKVVEGGVRGGQPVRAFVPRDADMRDHFNVVNVVEARSLA